MTAFDDSAKWYDALYSRKDYDRELASYRKVLGDDFRPRSIVDVGCGTGNSTLALRRAFPDATILAIEPSRAMRDVAQLKGVDAQPGSMRTFSSIDADLVVCFFNVVGYASIDLADFIRSLVNVYENTTASGVLLFDFMHQPEVSRGLRAVECRGAHRDGYDLHRTCYRTFDPLAGIVEYFMRYEVYQCGAECDRSTEIHQMRCFTASELTLLLSLAGWQASFYGCSGDMPRATDFYMLCKATKNG